MGPIAKPGVPHPLCIAFTPRVVLNTSQAVLLKAEMRLIRRATVQTRERVQFNKIKSSPLHLPQASGTEVTVTRDSVVATAGRGQPMAKLEASPIGVQEHVCD